MNRDHRAYVHYHGVANAVTRVAPRERLAHEKQEERRERGEERAEHAQEHQDANVRDKPVTRPMAAVRPRAKPRRGKTPSIEVPRPPRAGQEARQEKRAENEREALEIVRPIELATSSAPPASFAAEATRSSDSNPPAAPPSTSSDKPAESPPTRA